MFVDFYSEIVSFNKLRRPLNIYLSLTWIYFLCMKLPRVLNYWFHYSRPSTGLHVLSRYRNQESWTDLFQVFSQDLNHSSACPWRVNFASKQVDFQFTCPDGQVEILDKTVIIKMNDSVHMTWESLFPVGHVKYWIYSSGWACWSEFLNYTLSVHHT